MHKVASTLSVEFYELKEGYENDYMRNETYESEAPLKIKFDLRTYILENPASVIHFSSVLHHTITNHADLIPNNIFEKCLSKLPRKVKYFLIKNAYGNVLLIAESALN